MNTKVYIQFLVTNNKLLSKEAALLKSIIKKHAKKAGLILDIPSINITVYANPDFTTPETGESGYTPSKDWIHLYIDPKRKKKELDKIVNDIVPATIYHEMNHASRWRNIGYGDSLLDAIIAEGLATVFANEQWSKFKAPWSIFSKNELKKLLNIIRKRNKKNDKRYNHNEWFYGTGKTPRWAGYKIGSHIIESFRKNNENIKWKNMSKMKTEEIITKSSINIM